MHLGVITLAVHRQRQLPNSRSGGVHRPAAHSSCMANKVWLLVSTAPTCHPGLYACAGQVCRAPSGQQKSGSHARRCQVSEDPEFSLPACLPRAVCCTHATPLLVLRDATGGSQLTGVCGVLSMHATHVLSRWHLDPSMSLAIQCRLSCWYTDAICSWRALKHGWGCMQHSSHILTC